MKKHRGIISKLHTLLFGKDLRITEGDVFSNVYEYDYSSYLPIDSYLYEEELIAAEIFDIRDFGASIKNEDNSCYINIAIDEASKHNGVVLIDGGVYKSTSIILKSNITLFIKTNSSIQACISGNKYEKPSLVYGNDINNITICGGGTINGMGEFFGRKPEFNKNMLLKDMPKYIDVVQMRRDYRSQLRFAHPSKFGGCLSLSNCENIKIRNIMLYDSASWTCHLKNSNDVTLEDIVINNNRNVANADGFDVSGCTNIYIKHCFVSTADDGICLKNAIWLKNDGIMENINVSDCEIISRTNSIKIGTETTNEIRNISISNCKCLMPDLYPGSVSGISIESADGSSVHDINISDISMDNISCPIFIRLCNRNRASIVNSQSSNAIEKCQDPIKGGMVSKNVFNNKGSIDSVSISNINCSGAMLPIILAGYKEKNTVYKISNINIKDISVEYAKINDMIDKRLFIPEYVDVYPESWRFRNLPSYGIWCRHVDNLKMYNIQVNPPLNVARKENIFIDTTF